MKPATIAADALVLATVMVAAYHLRWLLPGRQAIAFRHLLVGTLSLPLWIALFAHYRLYCARWVASRRREFESVVRALGAAVLSSAAVSYLLRVPVATAWLVLCLGLGIVAVLIEREVVRRTFARLRRRGRLLRRVVVVGCNVEALALAAMLGRNRALGYQVVGLVAGDIRPGGDSGGEGPGNPPLLGTLEQLPEVLEQTGAGGVLIATTAVEAASSNRLTRQLTDAGIHVELSSSLRDIRAERLTMRSLGAFPVVYVEPVKREGWRAAAKQAFDLVAAAGALVVLAPVMLVIAVLVKLDSPGPVLFRQERIGKDGVTFRILKFRTMVADAHRLLDEVRHLNEADGPLFKIRRDPRITRVGARLRSSSLDELPQLWNVLRGEMSLVGPRPALPFEIAGWSPELHARLRVKPGMTGMWQVHGRSKGTFDKYMRLDLYYVDNWSLLTDLAIIARTVPSVVLRRGS